MFNSLRTIKDFKFFSILEFSRDGFMSETSYIKLNENIIELTNRMIVLENNTSVHQFLQNKISPGRLFKFYGILDTKEKLLEMNKEGYKEKT